VPFALTSRGAATTHPAWNLQRRSGVLKSMGSPQLTEMEPSGTLNVVSVVSRNGTAGESRAQRRLAAAYEEHARELGSLAFLLTGDASAAEDLVHEAFVRAFPRLGYLRRQEALGAYLRRTVVRLAGKQFRRGRSERAFLARSESSGPMGVTQPDVELREQLWAALRRLPPRQRAALVLRFYEDLSESETARVLGCRVGTVKSLVHRGLTAMREEIGGGDEPRE
jgi:RNA polymerase sigma-70 factor (sigma-E family)